jgi:hypothetical protein
LVPALSTDASGVEVFALGGGEAALRAAQMAGEMMTQGLFVGRTEILLRVICMGALGHYIKNYPAY